MSGKEQFVKLPREVLESAALRSLGIHGWRVVHFLMLEHLRRGGRHNGHLKAPHRQLASFGVGPKYVSRALAEAEISQLVERHRNGMRVATTYTLTWLPLHDGSQPSDAWRDYEPAPPPQNLPIKRKAALPIKGKADGQILPIKREAEPSENLPIKREALYRSSYHGGGSLKEVGGEGVQPLGAGAAAAEGERRPDDGQPVRRPSASIGPPCPYRGCGKPIGLCEHTRRPIPAVPSSGKPNGSTAP